MAAKTAGQILSTGLLLTIKHIDFIEFLTWPKPCVVKVWRLRPYAMG
jgi:hypothetical protein